MGIALYTEVWFTPLSLDGVRTAFSSISAGATYPLKLISGFKSRLDTRFEQFLRGDIKVHKVLSHFDDLAIYTLASLLQDKPSGTTAVPGIGTLNHKPIPGELGSRTGLPIGAGMGSSAAIVAATTVLFETLLDRHKTPSERMERVRFCERLKHGKAGPIDAASVVYGGLVRVNNSASASVAAIELSGDHDLVTGQGWYWVLHGRPDCGTGECVSQVAADHGSEDALWQAFATCTAAMEQAIMEGEDPRAAISENQRLLEHIGVVPESTKAFISEVEAVGGAAKICGAGAVRGDHGGVVLVRLDDPDAMAALMTKHPGLSWAPLKMSPTGAAAGLAPRVANVPEQPW